MTVIKKCEFFVNFPTFKKLCNFPTKNLKFGEKLKTELLKKNWMGWNFYENFWIVGSYFKKFEYFKIIEKIWNYEKIIKIWVWILSSIFSIFPWNHVRKKCKKRNQKSTEK